MDPQAQLHSQTLYRYDDEALLMEQAARAERIYEFNHLRPGATERRQALLCEIFGSVGAECHIEPALRASWGCHTHLGNRVFANFNLTLVDDTHIFIGDDVQFGPNVTLSTAGHPIDPDLRKNAYQFNLPIHIGANAWIGAHSVALPGVTIGENAVIGAGSVVTRDIPANVVAVGNPCRVLRAVGPRDKEYFYRDRKINPPRV